MTTTIEKSTPEKRKALGRGLDSLLPGGPRAVHPQPPAANSGTSLTPTVAPSSSAAPVHQPAGAGSPITQVTSGTSAVAPVLRPSVAEGVTELSLDLIDENPYQPRRDFGDDRLAELTASIKSVGVVQPVVVRPGKDGRYTLVVGERRCRASKMAGKERIPAIVRQVSEEQAAEMTIIENLMREDLNCMEQARGFATLSQEFGLTQEQIGVRTGCSREKVSNYMRLLKLPQPVQLMLQQGQLDFSIGRVLLNLLDFSHAQKIAEIAVKKNLSVLQLEDLVFETNVPLQKDGEDQKSRARWVDPNVRAAQLELERTLGVRVMIRDRKGRGTIVIEYANLEDFDRVLEMLKGRN
jgi:ParB family transcriptional regulator, chromosome partitioning protein